MLTKLSIHLGNLEEFPLVTESGMVFTVKQLISTTYYKLSFKFS
jgi:hypothetical protein